MPDSTTWTAACWRDGSLWVVHIRELGLTGRAALLSQVEGVARDLLRAAGQEDPATPARVVVEPLVPPRVRALLEAAGRARSVADWVGVSDVLTRRRLARQLAHEGLPVADIATALGVSVARARMLAGA
ncbi:MAG: hypothetical protein M3P93_00910, partial [Actinomycetota bacterium]|nr:hypothetical protein [Actinomycetota bacterium]